MPNESSTDIYKDLRSLTRADDRIVSFLEDVALDGVWFWDIADRSRGWVSDQFWRTLGYDPQDPPPFDWAALIDAADLADATMAFELHVMDASEPYEQVLRYRHASGRVVWIRSRGFAIRDSDGNPTHFLGTNQDITDLKEKRKYKYIANLKDPDQPFSGNAYCTSVTGHGRYIYTTNFGAVYIWEISVPSDVPAGKLTWRQGGGK